MSIFQVILLAIIQGAAELLPVSSSAHVIVAERIMGLDPSAPELTFLLVMLHTGTMFAVLLYFWQRWTGFLKNGTAGAFLRAIIIATAVTGFVGLGLKLFIEKIVLIAILGHQKGEIEELFSSLPLVATSLFIVGVYILFAAKKSSKNKAQTKTLPTNKDSILVGLTQAICLPFRGLSRSGSTISTSLIRNISHPASEDFSFALAVVLTPPVIALELRRLLKASDTHQAMTKEALQSLLQPGLLGMVFSFLAGLLALKLLSRWLEEGKWSFFGFYCLIASFIVLLVHVNFPIA
jgi:undecaprenyl-diphosphatase